jgi:hypothetical protein
MPVGADDEIATGAEGARLGEVVHRREARAVRREPEDAPSTVRASGARRAVQGAIGPDRETRLRRAISAVELVEDREARAIGRDLEDGPPPL